MSYSSNYNLNIRLSALESKINGGGVPTSSTLADVLLNGNSAGASDIDLNNQDILQVDNIDLVTINGSAYPPAVDNLEAVLTAGDTANDKNIILTTTFGPITTTFNAGSLITDGGFNLQTYDPLTINTTAGNMNLTASDSIDLTAGTDINLDTPSGVVNINGVPYPPAVDDLSAVLTAGNTATNSIILNNIGTGTNVINLLPNASANDPNITLTDGTTTNTINKNGYTTRNTIANSTHFLNFSDASTTGTGSIQKTAGISCNPSTNTITATTFSGALSGTASNATNVGITSDNTAGTYYIPFVKTSGTGNKPLFIDDVTTPFSYNPSTGSTSATSYTITATPSTASVASTFGQVGLVKITAVQVAITGSASSQNLSFASLFNSTYKNYRIILHPTTQVSFTAYPSYALQAFLGSGTLPTTASLYGFEMTSNATSVVSPIYTAGATISSAPLIFAVSSITNKEIIFDIQNVGYANTATQQVSLMCKSVYGNPGVSGASDRTITCSSSSGATITGLVIQQTSISVSNNFTLEAVVYGYNNL